MRRDGDGHKHSYSYRYGYGYAGYKREQRPRELNRKLLIGTLIFLLVAAPTVYFWHDYQTKRLSDSLWKYGEEQAAQENWKEASAAFYRVWDIRKDPKMLGEAVSAYDKQIGNSNPAELIPAYQVALGGVPERTDLRARLAELLGMQKRFQSALDQAEQVLATDAKNTKARKWRALSLLGLTRLNQPVEGVDLLEELKRVYVDYQQDFDIASALVTHIREDLRAQNGSELAAQADGVMNRLVAANPQNVNARLLRYQYRNRFKLPGAKQDIEQAVLLAPQNATVINVAAWDSLRDAMTGWRTSDYLTARQLFKNLIGLRPKNESGYLGLGDTEFLVAGSTDRAIEIWTLGREQAGDSLPLLLRIAEAQTNSQQYERVEQTLLEVDQFVASLPAGREQQRNNATASVALFRGKIMLSQGKAREAIVQLRRAADLGSQATGKQMMRPANKSTSFNALMSLGDTYALLGRAKDAAASFDEALKMDPDSEVALLKGAEGWASLGDVERAIRQVEKAKRLPRATAKVDRALAQYLLERELARPVNERDWRDFEESLKTARNQLADSWQLRLLEVDYAVHRDRINPRDNSQALGKLLAVEQDFPKELEVWKRLPFIYESFGLRSDADRALNQLEALTSSSGNTKLLTVDILLGRGQQAAAEQVFAGISSEKLSQEDRIARDRARVRIVEFTADEEDIDKALLEYRSKDEKDPFPIERLLDRRICGASTTSVPSNTELIQDLKQRQPKTEATWQYYAARLELRKQSPDLKQIQEDLASLSNRLPYWSRTHELAGRLFQRAGNHREMRIAFSNAIAKPRPNPELVRLLIDDHSELNDYLASIRIIEEHRQAGPMSRILVNGQWSDLRRKLDFAFVDRGLKQSGVPSSPMWSVLMSETPNASVASLSNVMLGLWESSLQQIDTEESLANVAAADFSSSDTKAFVLGQAYHLAERYQEAKRQYRNVVDDSERRLRAELYSGVVKAQVTRQRNRAYDLAQLKIRSKKRLEAVMRLRRAGQNDLAVAQKALEELVGTSDVESTDRILLAKCYSQLGDPDAAIEQLEANVESDASARHIAVLVDFLLRGGLNEKAQVWIDQLEEQTGWEKKTVLLRTRWMAATNRQREIKAFVEKFAVERFKQSPENPAREMRDVSEIYQSVGMIEDAERWLDTLANRFPDQAEPLSQLLVENDETDRAVQRCVEQLQSEPTAETATLLARILVYGEVNPTTLEQVSPLLAVCRERFPDDTSLLFALGNLHIKLAETSEAIDTLSKVTEFQPGHYLAWNNLAAILAEESGREAEAMRTIEAAIERAAYEIPTLLDTKAVVLIHQERYAAAAKILRDNVTQSRAATDARFYFHLAVALDRMQETEAANQALADALDLDLERSFLTSFEKAELDRLTEKMETIE